MIRSLPLVAALLLVLATPAAPQVRSIDALEVTVLPQPSWERPEKQGTGSPLKIGPDYVLLKDGRLYVRTYNTDYIFEIQRH